MVNFKKITSVCAGLAVASFMVAGTSFANDWQQNHPRRAQVNHRLNNENRRVNQGLKKGQLSGQEAQQLHSEDQSIRTQEQEDAAAHDGHITRGEQKQINQEENAEGHQIYQDRHDGQ
jgi:uncharacterized protein HemX